MNQQLLFARIEAFYQQFQDGELDYAPDLARVLQRLADGAWDVVDELYQLCTRIDP